MAKIKQLSEKIANMIAAGEVVERPASVIKELVENAIDANASMIKVEVFGYGLKKIIVTDNGFGMDDKDAILAFSRHATSKIYEEDDLSHINSLGFRGEALPSIASVSKLTLLTKTANSEGFFVELEAGKIIKKGTNKSNIGTKITVSDLFYNTPARFKYIKSENAEKNAIIDVFDNLSLSNSSIAFKLLIDDKLVKETFGNNDIYSLLSQIYGKEITNSLTIFDQSFQKMSIKGYLVNPNYSRSKKNDISVFINGRYIKNYVLTNAVIEGYHGYLMTNRYPIALIYINMDSSLVDVNVHPQKYEVKLANEYLLAYQITNYIKDALSSKKIDLVESKIAKVDNVQIEPLDLSFGTSYHQNELEDVANKKRTLVIEEEKDSKIPLMDYIGSLGGTYLLFQNNDGLYLIDQHAAAERIRYENIYNNLKNPVIVTKNMLIPKEISLPLNDIHKLINNKEKLVKLGFDITNQKISSIPSWLNEDDLETVLEELIKMIDDKKELDLGLIRDDLAKSIACKGAIKANKNLSLIEIENLMKELNKLDNPYFCPHGRPTIIKLTFHEIEKLFKRIL